MPRGRGLPARTHLRQRHPVDDEVGLLGALPRKGVMVDVVGAGVPVVLALHVEEGAFGAAAAQRQGLLVVVEVVEGRSQRGAAHNVHFIRLFHVPRYQADIILADFLFLA